MRTRVDCFPCLFSHSLRAAKAATDDELLQRKVLDAVAAMLPEFSLDLKPPEISQQIYRLIGKITDNKDPFRKEKDEANGIALSMYPRLKQVTAESPDALLTACKLAIAGNSLDLGPDFDPGHIDDVVKEALSSPLAIDDFDRLSESLKCARRILYLGDNAGEIVFDKLLLEEMKRIGDPEIFFAVREKPVINDATMTDALAVGMDKVATVVSNGSDAPATILAECSADLRRIYHSSDIIISKGQGNYESLYGELGHIFFLLRVKCPVLSDHLKVENGDAVLKEQFIGT